MSNFTEKTLDFMPYDDQELRLGWNTDSLFSSTSHTIKIGITESPTNVIPFFRPFITCPVIFKNSSLFKFSSLEMKKEIINAIQQKISYFIKFSPRVTEEIPLLSISKTISFLHINCDKFLCALTFDLILHPSFVSASTHIRKKMTQEIMTEIETFFFRNS